MKSWLEFAVTDPLRMSSRMMETGLEGIDLTLRTMRSAVDRWAGEEPQGPPSVAPVHGPPDLDTATADLANRWLRQARLTEQTPMAWWELARAMLEEMRDLSTEHLEEPRKLFALPLQLPLSMGTLWTQESLRSLVAAQAIRPEILADFLAFVVEIFSDLQVFFSLQYSEEIERYEALVENNPGDAQALLELGRTYSKRGLFQEALGSLELAAAGAPRGSKLWRRAHYESLVAAYRRGDAQAALDYGLAVLQVDGSHERARYWTWLAAEKLGGYPATVPEELRLVVKSGNAPTTTLLEDVAATTRLDKTCGGRGTAVLDIDGNGYLDVVVAGAHAGCSLFRNNGDGTFTDISTGSGLDRCVYGFALAVGDYNNDGLDDLFITGLGFFDGQGILMRNNGDGTFTDVTREAGLGSWGPAFTATWVDYDGDGFLDLFVVNNLGGLFDRKTPNRLFHNNGDGTFTDVTEEAGLTTPWPSLGATWGDFRNVGLPDLFVSNLGRAQLFRNNGDGTFTDVSRSSGIDAPAIGSASLCCDIDNDGWLDIVQMTYSRPQDAIYTLRHGEGPPGGSPMRVFRNNRDGTFSEVAAELGLNGCWGTMSVTAGDFNNDGHLDLFLGNGDPSMDRTEASMLLENDGERFRNVTFAAGLPLTGKGHGVNMADLAGDGRLHLIVGAGGLYPGDLLTTTVHRPRELPGNYLNVRLEATAGHRNAIGARLRLRAGGRDQHRLVSCGSGFGCLPFEQHFGLGDLQSVELLEIVWPGGASQRWETLPINQTLKLVEGQEGWEEVYAGGPTARKAVS